MSTVSYTFSQMQRPNKHTRRPTLIADHQYAWLNMHDFSASSSSFGFQSMPSHVSTGSYPGGSISNHSQLTDYDSLPRGIISQEQYQRNRSPSQHEGAPGAHGRHRQTITSTDQFRSQSPDRNGSTASNGSAGQQGYTTHRPEPKKGGRIEKPSVEDDTEPAWRALKTKAGKDRKRLPLACIACRRKKIRCSGEQPACKRCTRSRVPCVYKVGGRKRADSTTEAADKANDDSNPECGPDGDHDEATKHTGPHDSNRVMKRRSKKRNSKDNLSLGFNTHGDGPRTMLGGTYGQDEDDLFKEGIDALPSQDMQEHLFEVFFDRVYGQPYYLLHRPTYMRKLRNGGLPPVLVLSVCAVAARFSVNPKLASNSHPFTRGEEWASVAREICLRRYGRPDPTVLNCLILLSIHDFGTGQESSSWSLGGQAIRMAFALRLHEDLEYDPRSPGQKLSFLEREERRRAMWACYLLDRFSSADTDQPLFINESVIDTPLPVNERFFELDVPMHTEFIDGGFYAEPDADHDADGTSSHDNLGVAALMVRALSVWSGVVMHLKQRHRRRGEALWRELARLEGYSRQNDELLKTLPVHLQWSRENIERHSNEGSIGQYLLLHVSIPLTDLFIYQTIASNIRAACGGAIANDCHAKAAAHTLACAGRISEVLRQGDRLQAATFAPFAGYCALSSFSVQALYLASPNPQIKAMTEDNCAINLKYLHRLARHWGKFREAEQNSHQAFKTAIDAVREGGPNTLLQDTEYLHRYSHGMIDADSIQPNMAQDWDEREFSILDQRLELRSIDDFFSLVSVTLQNNQAPDGMQSGAAPLLKRRLTAAHLEQQNGEPGDMAQANINGQQVAIDAVSLPTPRGSFSTGPVKGAMLSQQQASMTAALTSPSSHSYTSSTGLAYHGNNRVDNVGYFGDVMPMGMSQPSSANAQPVFTMPPTGDLPMLEIGNGGWHDDMDGDPFALPADVSSWFLPYEVEASEVNQDMMMAPEGGNVAAQAQQAISPSFNQGIAIRNGFNNNA